MLKFEKQTPKTKGLQTFFSEIRPNLGSPWV